MFLCGIKSACVKGPSQEEPERDEPRPDLPGQPPLVAVGLLGGLLLPLVTASPGMGPESPPLLHRLSALRQLSHAPVTTIHASTNGRAAM